MVRTLDAVELRDLCRALAGRVGSYRPDVVVGIATGGAEVAAELVRALDGDVRLAVVRSQRPGTRLKQGRVASGVLRGLPRGLADVARRLEVEYREAAYHLARSLVGDDRTDVQARVARPEALVRAVTGARRVLVVDDTLDSGQTLSGVVEVVAAASPEADIRTAVLATTWRRPPVRPDYVLHERLLLRLPSSFDA